MHATVRHVLGPQEGESVNLFALGVRFMIDGDATGGWFSLVEHPLPARALGAPLHTHRNEDEYSYVLEGGVGLLLAAEEADEAASERSSAATSSRSTLTRSPCSRSTTACGWVNFRGP